MRSAKLNRQTLLTFRERVPGDGGVQRGGTLYLIPSNSTSKISVAFGGMTPPAPCAP